MLRRDRLQDQHHVAAFGRNARGVGLPIRRCNIRLIWNHLRVGDKFIAKGDKAHNAARDIRRVALPTAAVGFKVAARENKYGFELILMARVLYPLAQIVAVRHAVADVFNAHTHQVTRGRLKFQIVGRGRIAAPYSRVPRVSAHGQQRRVNMRRGHIDNNQRLMLARSLEANQLL